MLQSGAWQIEGRTGTKPEYGPGAADVLFQVVDQRYLKGRPILFTTNKPLKLWGRVLHDEELARAIIDRTLHYGEYLKLTGASYRLKDRNIDFDHPIQLQQEKADEKVKDNQ